MDRLVKLISNASTTRAADDDDFADRLSSRYTVVLLVTFAVLVGMNQYVRNPITCWSPNHFTGAHVRYTSRYCWVKNTYYLPWASELPPPNDDGVPGSQVVPASLGDPSRYSKRQMVTYYQWIPFILLLQAIMFYAPTLVWRALNSKAGIDADDILEAAQTVSHAKGDTRERTLLLMTKQFDRFLGSRQELSSRCGCGINCVMSMLLCRMCGRRVGCYLLLLFLFSKVLYLCNVVGQLFILNSVLGMKYNTFGIDMIRNIADSQTDNRDWTEDQSYVAFPRVTLCDFRVRGQDLGNVQRYTVQCVLPINAYNEKIYAFLWFWMVMVAFACSVSLVLWIVRSLSTVDRLRFVANHLKAGDRIPVRPGPKETDLVRKFTRDYLRQDGSFLLRLIAHNTDNITTTELTCSVWDDWKVRYAAGGQLLPGPDSGNHSDGLYPDVDTKAMQMEKC